MLLLYKNDDIFPQFIEIEHIVEDINIFFIGKLWVADGFEDHVHAYTIRLSMEITAIKFFN